MNRFFTLLLAASCLTAVGQTEYCLDGTVWDDEMGGCVSINSADINNDGCVQLGDLLDLLIAFGDCGDVWPELQCGYLLEYQGYNYETVQIGEQCWFAENLRSENYENGDVIPAGLSESEWENTTSGAVAVYGEGVFCINNSPDINACDPAQSLNEYGRLYNWHAVDDNRGLCPSGWHVPSDEEWTVMTYFLGGNGVAGGYMKADYGWDGDGNGTNSSGFSGFPGGYRSINGSFLKAGDLGGWWCSSANGSAPWSRRLYDYDDNIGRDDLAPEWGFSVRCIKDTE